MRIDGGYRVYKKMYKCFILCVDLCSLFFLCYLLICKCVVIFVNVPFAMNNLVLLKFLNCY